MKSRTSYFNATVFKKNLTRFAPCWGLYTVGLLMALVSLIDSGSQWFAPNVCDFVQIMSLITPCYALLCTQLLFGDLYNSRMCNALHAMPLARENWFVTNVLSGFAFHLIPTVIFAVLAGIYGLFGSCNMAWLAGPVWLLGVNLQFLCFFGIAVFSAFCVGSRFAQAVIYGILNFASLIMGWLVDTIFLPMYYGIKINMEPFFWFSPAGQMTQEPFCNHTATYRYDEWDPGTLERGANFGYYFLVAAVGIGFLALAMLLYRRRKLECAGDFMAVKGLEPVFMVFFTIVMGAVFHFISDDIFGMETWFFLFLGQAVGWFTGRMLLERTPRVFRLKNYLHCGLVMVIFTLVLGAAYLDPFGIESWVPEREAVKSVTIADGHYNYHSAELTMEEPEEIRKLIQIHEEALHNNQFGLEYVITFEDAYEELILKEEAASMNFSMSFTITYEMKNGRTVKRYYNIWMGGETGTYLNELFSSPEAVLQVKDAATFAAIHRDLYIRDTWEGRETFVRSEGDIRSLYEAILADCEAGTMAQNSNFHGPDVNLYWINSDNGLDILVFSNCENTLNWLREYGVDVDELIERYTG